jgi:hypothetical protein
MNEGYEIILLVPPNIAKQRLIKHVSAETNETSRI